MSTNKKFRIQNGVDVKGELTVNDVVIIRADGTIVAGAIADAVSTLVDAGALTGSGSSIIDSDSQIFIDVNSNTVAIASETAARISDIANLQTQIDSLGVNADTQAEVDSLQSQIDSIVGASPETLDTLVEIVSAFEGADSDIQALLAANSSSLSANTAAIGVETTQRIAGDVTLQQNIDAEVTRATAAELANAAAIAAEAATRGAAVSALQASQFTYNDSDGWTGNLIPSADNQYALGSPDRVWKDLYIGPGSLYINGTKILEDNSGTITMYADAGQNLSFGATGGGTIDLNAGDESVQLKSDLVMSVGETISTVGGAPTKFGGDVDMGTHQVTNVGTPVDPSDAATKEYVDGLNAEGTISGDKVFEDNVTIQGNLSVEGTTTTLDTQTLTVADNIIDLNSNVSTGVPTLNAGIRIMRGDEPAVQLRWNELEDRWEVYDGVTATPIAVESSDVITEGSNNLFFTVVRARDAVSQDIADAVAAEASSRGAAIDAEIARATSAEAQLAADIVAEATARAEADSDETAARISADATLQANIDAEAAARIASDLNEVQTRQAAIDDLQAQLNSVTGTDLSSIQSQIDAIVGTSPETLDTIQEVVAAFEGADSDLTSLITGNSSTITAVNQSLTQEVSDRTFAVAAEKQQREDADSDLQSAIDSLSATVSSNNAAKTSAISTETAARIAGDEGEAAAREAAITAESTARVAGDATVQAAVDAEVARATAAEQANASAISAETARATAAEADLQNQIDQVEATGATHPLFSTMGDLPDASANHGMFAHVHAEGAAYFAHAGQWVKLANFSDLDGIDLSSIQSQIDAIVGSSPETLDTLQEIVAAFESADGDLQTLMTANASSISGIESKLGYGSKTYSESYWGIQAEYGAQVGGGQEGQRVTFHGGSPSGSPSFASSDAVNHIKSMIQNQPGIFKVEFTNSGEEIVTITSTQEILVGVPDGFSENHVGIGGSVTDKHFWIKSDGNMSVTQPAVGTSIPKGSANSDDNYKSFDLVKAFDSSGNVLVTKSLPENLTGNIVSVDLNSLDTTATTLVGAVNELHAEMADNSAVTSALQTETDARVAAISAEETARIAGDATNASAIVDEANARAAADTAETQARISADNSLQTQIDAETAARESSITSQATLISAQSTALNTEISNRTSADADLQTQIDDIVADNAARTASGATTAEVDAVQSNLDAEVVRAQLAEQANASAIVTGDAALQAQLDAIVGTSPETLDTLQEIVTAYSNADSTLQGLIDANTGALQQLQTTIGADNVPLITPDIGETITYTVEYAGRQFYAVSDTSNIYVYDSVDPSTAVASIVGSDGVHSMDANSDALYVRWSGGAHYLLLGYKWADLVVGITQPYISFHAGYGESIQAFAVSETHAYAFETHGTQSIHVWDLATATSTWESGYVGNISVNNFTIGEYDLRVFGDKLVVMNQSGEDKVYVYQIAANGIPSSPQILEPADLYSDNIAWGQGERYGAIDHTSTLVAIGAYQDDTANTGSDQNAGSVYLFNPDNLNEPHTKLYPPAEYDKDHFNFGYAVAATDTRLIVSALDSNNLNREEGNDSNGIVFIYDATNLSLPPLVIHPPSTGISNWGHQLFEESNRLFVSSSDGDAIYVYDLTNMDQDPVQLIMPSIQQASGTFGKHMMLSPAATVSQTITDTIIPAQGLGNSINYLESKRQELRADLEANLAAIQTNASDITSIAADVATNTANIATNAAAIVAIDADRAAFEASVQAQVDQVNADRTAFEASVNAGRDSFEADTLANSLAYRNEIAGEVANLTSQFDGSVATFTSLANDIESKQGDSIVTMPDSTTSITYDKEVAGQHYMVQSAQDGNYYLYNSADLSGSNTPQIGSGTPFSLPAGYADPYGDHLITRDYFIAFSSGDILVYDIATISPSATPIKIHSANGFNGQLIHDGGNKFVITGTSDNLRLYDIPSLATDSPAYIQCDHGDLPAGTVDGNWVQHVAINDTYVFVANGANQRSVTVLSKADLSYVRQISNPYYDSGNDNVYGARVYASNTILYMPGRQQYSYYGWNRSAGRGYIYNAMDLNEAPKTISESNFSAWAYGNSWGGWGQGQVGGVQRMFHTNEFGAAVTDDELILSTWPDQNVTGEVVIIPKTAIDNNNISASTATKVSGTTYASLSWQYNRSLQNLHAVGRRLTFEVYGAATASGQDKTGVNYIVDLDNPGSAAVLQETGGSATRSFPRVSPAETVTVSVTETFNPSQDLTSAINYLGTKNEELETAIAGITGSSNLLADIQAVEASVDFKLLAQDQRFDSDKAEQEAIYAAANAEQAAIYDSANAAHVAYFEQYTSGETAARELADQNLQSQITSNEGDIVSLQSQIDTIVGTSPETLDTLQELVSAYENADNSLQTLITSNNEAHEELDLFVRPIEQNFVFNPVPQEIPNLFSYSTYSSSSLNSENEWLVNVSGVYTGSTWHSQGQLSGGLVRYITLSVVPNKQHKVFLTSKNRASTLQLSVLNGGAPQLGGGNGDRIAADAVGSGSTEVTQELTFTPTRSDLILFVTAYSSGSYTLSDFYVIEGDGQPYTLETQEQGVVPAINELHSEIGDDVLSTSSQTLSGAINELKSDLDPLSNPALETAATDIVGAINELNTSVQSITGSDTQFLDDIATNQTDIATLQTDLGAIDTRVTTAEAAINTNAGNLATEVADRTAGDAALQAQIDNIVGTSPETLDTLQEVVAAFEGADDDLQALITGNTSIVSTHTTQIATLDNQIHAGAGLNVPNMPTQVSRYVYQDQYIVATSGQDVMVFDANSPLSAPTVINISNYADLIKSTTTGYFYDNGTSFNAVKIVRDKLVLGFQNASLSSGNSNSILNNSYIHGTSHGIALIFDLDDLSGTPVVKATPSLMNMTSYNMYELGLRGSGVFGNKVAGSEDYIIIASKYHDNSSDRNFNDGRVYLYNINDLSLDPVILSSPSSDNIMYHEFGATLHVDGSDLFIGARDYDNLSGQNGSKGVVYKYNLDNLLEPPQTVSPYSFTGLSNDTYESIGYGNNGEIASNSTILAVGAPYAQSYSGTGIPADYYQGEVYLHPKSSMDKALRLEMPSSYAQQYAYFGTSIAMNDNYLYVNAIGYDHDTLGNDLGLVFVYDVNDFDFDAVGSTWGQTTISPTPVAVMSSYDGQGGDNYGHKVRVNGGKVIISSRYDDDVSTNSGSIYIYDENALTGIPIKISEAFASIDTSQLGTDMDITAATGAVEIVETIIPSAGLSEGINYLESKTNELSNQITNIDNTGALLAASNAARLDAVEVSNVELNAKADLALSNVISGDSDLQAQIDNLTIAASGDVSLESAARIAGDSDEAAARIAGDATVQAAVDAEVARATGVEAGLQSQLDAIVGTSPETLDTLQEVVAAFEGADGDLQTLITTNASTISDLSDFVGNGGSSSVTADDFSGVSVAQVENGMSLSIAGNPWGSTFTNLPSYLSETGSFAGTDINTANGALSWTIPASTVYMIMDSGWQQVSTSGWAVVESGVTYITGYGNGTQTVYSKTFDAGTYDFYTKSAMYIFVPTVASSSATLETTATTIVTAINEVHSELNAEVLRAQTAEGAEEVRALAAEAVLQSNINTESSARLAGDAGLQSQIDTLSGTQTSDKSALEVSIANETARATAAENTLQSNIDAESTRAQTAEAANAAAVVTEKVRAEAVEAGLAADIAVETARATAAEAQLANHLGANFTDGSITIDGLATFNGGLYFGDGTGTIGFNATVDHIQALSDLDMMSNSVINVAAPVDSADAANKAYVDATTQVVSDRVDAILNGAGESLDTIVEVVAAFENADSDIQALITSNSASVTANTNAINAEVAARQQAILDEATARANADSDLSAGLSNETSRALAAEGVLTSDLAAEVARATYAETGLATDIASEVSRATAAEGVNATAISAETTRATTVEASLAQDIADEALRAQGAEAVLTSDVSANATAISNLQSQVAGVSTSSGSSNIEMTAEVDMSGNKITGMADPTAAQDAATKSYVDATVATEATARTTEDSSLQSNIDAANARIDAILNGSVESLDTVVEVVSAFEGADSDIQNLITANASTISQNAAAIATEATARANADSDESALRAAADAVLTADLAATNVRTAGIDASSGTIEVSSNVDMNDNNITGVNDVYAARGFIDTIESGSLTVQTGTVDFEGSTVNFGSATLIGNGFGNATNDQIDQHLNVSAAGTNEFLKWNGTDYEFTDYIQGRLATDQLEVGGSGSITASLPSSTLDWQDGLVHFGGSQVIVDTPASGNLAANKSYVDNADSDLNASLSTAIANEESRATTAEGVLTTNLTNEISRATSAEAALASDISAEETRALAAEAAEASARADADSDLQSAIDAEVARATAAEAVNAQAVVDEATARAAADTTLQSNIDTVSGRVDAILNGSSESLDTIVEVVAAFENADSDLQTLISSNAGSHTANAAAISAEETRATNAEAVLQSAIDAEETRATGVEADLQSQITSEIASRSAADQSMKDDLDSDIAAEAALRSAGDATLQSAIDVEVARATAAEGVLQSLLDSEQSARILSDQGLQSAITAEENARVAADAVLQSAIDAEELARTSADNTLQANIDAVDAAVTAITNGSPETLNQLVEVVAAFEDADSDLQTLITNLGGDASALTARVATLEGEMDATELATTSNANAISAETAARVAAVQVNADAITAEATTRAAAITAEQNARAAAIAASESDRDSADADLQAQITALTTTEQTSKSSLQALLNQEVADRTAGDSDLTDSLAAEVARATAAESALSSDISDESSARATADASLQTQINNILSNTDATALNSLAEIVAEFQSVDGTLTGLINSNGSRITALESSVGTIEAWNTDNVSEGTTNLYFTDARAKACLTGGLCIDYNSTTGEIAIDEVEAASSLTVAESHDANALGGEAPSYYRINVYDAAGNLVN